MTEVPDDYLLLRYLEGNCSQKEQRQVEEWLSADPSHADRFEGFVAKYSSLVYIDKDHIREELFRNIKETPDVTGRPSFPEKRFSHAGLLQKRKGLQRWLPAAAVILIAFTSGILTYLWQVENTEVQETVFIERTVPSGTSTTITLSDGSTVRLNAESTLRFPENFGMGSEVREVFLEGEAFFEVTEAAGAPFIVRSGQLETTVLGTAFNVKAYPGDDLVQVAVAEGKVSVKQRDIEFSSEPVMLEPDQLITYNRKNDELKKEQGDIRELIAWKDGILLFHDKPVAEATKMLERWYDTTIVIEREDVKNCVIHGEYKDKSLETVLKMMQFTLGINYAFTEDGVMISGGRCQ